MTMTLEVLRWFGCPSLGIRKSEAYPRSTAQGVEANGLLVRPIRMVHLLSLRQSHRSPNQVRILAPTWDQDQGLDNPSALPFSCSIAIGLELDRVLRVLRSGHHQLGASFSILHNLCLAFPNICSLGWPYDQGSASERQMNQEQQSQQNQDPWAKLFESAQANDIAQCKAWNDEVANLLIFAALFSAIVTAFLVEAYKMLEPDQSELAVALLIRLVMRFDNSTDLTLPSPLPDLPFTAEAPSVRIGIYWTLSLILSLGSSLIGIVCLQWLREHRSYPEEWSAELKFTVFQMRSQMLRKWHVHTFLAGLPLIIIMSLILFFVGLAEFIISLKITRLTITTAVSILFFTIFIVATTAIPTISSLTQASRTSTSISQIPLPSPFKSPQAQVLRFAKWLLHSLGRWIINKLVPPREIGPINRPVTSFGLGIKRIAKVSIEWFREKFQPIELPHLLQGLHLILDWTDLDREWVSIRHLSSFHLLSQDDLDFGVISDTTFIGRSETFPVDWERGPIQDQLEGILDFYQRHSSDAGMRDLVFQCLQRSLPINDADATGFHVYFTGTMKIMNEKVRLWRPRGIHLPGLDQLASGADFFLFPGITHFHPKSDVLAHVALLQFAKNLHLPLEYSLGEKLVTQSFFCLFNPTNYRDILPMEGQLGPGLVWASSLEGSTADGAPTSGMLKSFLGSIGALFQVQEDWLIHGLPHQLREQENMTKTFRKFFNDTRFQETIVKLIDLLNIIFKPMATLTNDWRLGILPDDDAKMPEDEILKKWLRLSDFVQGLHVNLLRDEDTSARNRLMNVSRSLDTSPLMSIFSNQLSTRREWLKLHRRAVRNCG
ncbi:unnamed protein product [Cyclocybe aegerita]|uniref:DUF6535 domain-containing protein n=1 Tax=Cyclocybe aegerita TaxID=1973307 RepID=A0A8S0VUQ5_CYCAE|nr:unnamed protein product [Cyclocybe aegerita]